MSGDLTGTNNAFNRSFAAAMTNARANADREQRQESIDAQNKLVGLQTSDLELTQQAEGLLPQLDRIRRDSAAQGLDGTQSQQAVSDFTRNLSDPLQGRLRRLSRAERGQDIGLRKGEADIKKTESDIAATKFKIGRFKTEDDYRKARDAIADDFANNTLRFKQKSIADQLAQTRELAKADEKFKLKAIELRQKGASELQTTNLAAMAAQEIQRNTFSILQDEAKLGRQLVKGDMDLIRAMIQQSAVSRESQITNLALQLDPQGQDPEGAREKASRIVGANEQVIPEVLFAIQERNLDGARASLAKLRDFAGATALGEQVPNFGQAPVQGVGGDGEKTFGVTGGSDRRTLRSLLSSKKPEKVADNGEFDIGALPKDSPIRKIESAVDLSKKQLASAVNILSDVSESDINSTWAESNDLPGFLVDGPIGGDDKKTKIQFTHPKSISYKISVNTGGPTSRMATNRVDNVKGFIKDGLEEFGYNGEAILKYAIDNKIVPSSTTIKTFFNNSQALVKTILDKTTDRAFSDIKTSSFSRKKKASTKKVGAK